VNTEYGEVKVFLAQVDDREVYFLPRHGLGHSVPPHLVNTELIFVLFKSWSSKIIATNAVGSLNPEIKPGTVVLVDQFLDFTKGRKSTFFEEGKVVHTDMTNPYCPEMIEVASRLLLLFHFGKEGYGGN